MTLTVRVEIVIVVKNKLGVSSNGLNLSLITRGRRFKDHPRLLGTGFKGHPKANCYVEG